MKNTIRLTESQLNKLIRQTIAEQINEDMNMDQYSEFNYKEIAHHLAEDLADYGVIDGNQYYNEDKILLELPNNQYIYLDFDFNDDGSLYQVYIDIDETDKEIIKLIGTPYYEVYRLGKGENFDYDTLLGYVKKILDIHNNAAASVEKSWNESVIRAVMENIKKKLNEDINETQTLKSLSDMTDEDFQKLSVWIGEYFADTVDDSIFSFDNDNISRDDDVTKEVVECNVDLPFPTDHNITVQADVEVSVIWRWDNGSDYVGIPSSWEFYSIDFDSLKNEDVWSGDREEENYIRSKINWDLVADTVGNRLNNIKP